MVRHALQDVRPIATAPSRSITTITFLMIVFCFCICRCNRCRTTHRRRWLLHQIRREAIRVSLLPVRWTSRWTAALCHLLTALLRWLTEYSISFSHEFAQLLTPYFLKVERSETFFERNQRFRFFCKHTTPLIIFDIFASIAGTSSMWGFVSSRLSVSLFTNRLVVMNTHGVANATGIDVFSVYFSLSE